MSHKDLTIMLADSHSYNVGEMAHMIARKPDGPRGVPLGGSDSYENLILLCPTCHRTIDKAPENEYPTELLHACKDQHENSIRQKGSERIYSDIQDLKKSVSRRLTENKMLWVEFGPKSITASNDPGSNLYILWKLRKIDTIVPNNRAIINEIEANIDLLGNEDFEAFLAFKTHANAFENHQYDRIDVYPRFPSRFAEVFGNE
jgi:hypothetical protein